MRFPKWLLINDTLCGDWYKALWNGCSLRIHGQSYMYFSTTELYIHKVRYCFNYLGSSLARCHCMPHRLTRSIDYIPTFLLIIYYFLFCFCCCSFLGFFLKKMLSVWKIEQWPATFSPISKAVVDFAGSHLGVTNILIQCTINYHLLSFTNLNIWTFCCTNNRKLGHISISDIILTNIESRVWKDNFIHILLNHHWRSTLSSNYITVHHGRNYLSMRQFHCNQSVGGGGGGGVERNIIVR